MRKTNAPLSSGSWRVLIAAALLLGLVPRAGATFGNPVQGPDLPPAGSLEIYPSLGVLVGGDDFADTEAFLLMPRLRYTFSSRFQIDGHLGGIFGDLNAFAVGAGFKFQILEQGAGTPVHLSGFFGLDLAVGEMDFGRWEPDVVFFTMLTGFIVGHTFPEGGLDLTPYGGLGFGFTLVDMDVAGDDTNTEFAFDFLFGFELGISESMAAFMEFDIGPTDGLPDFTWHLGFWYRF